MKVLITELIWPIGLKTLETFAEVEYDPTLWSNRGALLEKIKDVDAVIVRNQTHIDAELLQAGIQLKAVGRLGVGLDNIDVKTANLLKIPVVYAKNANAISVAEYVLSAMLDAARPLRLAGQDVRNGNWNRKRFTREELYGKTLGLVGMGEIAHRVAKRALSLEMRVVGYDPYVTPYDFTIAETGIGLTSFQQLLATADFISIHVPLTAQTKSMFSISEFRQMKKNAYIINTSRGGIIDEGALLKVINDQIISGAYLDVLEEEPVNPLHPLLQYDNVVITPHIAGLTEESQNRTSLLVAQEVGKVLRGDPTLCSVDMKV